MAESVLRILIQPVAAVGKRIWQYSKRLYAERKASRTPLGTPKDFIEENLDQTLKRIIRAHVSADGSEQDVLTLLERNADLVGKDPVLASAKAWALFHVGRWKEARALNDELPGGQLDPSKLNLDINLAIQVGDWERFPVIVEREWERRDVHTAQTLLRLAFLAAEVDVTSARAMDLARLAARGAASDPQVLMGAYILAIQLGRDREADPAWISEAARLSAEDGPVRMVDVRTMIEELAPAHRERTEKVERALLKGQIPLHLAAEVLNTPLARLLLDMPKRNFRRSDGRLRTILPIVSGARQPIPMSRDSILGLDITSVLVLEQLDVLSALSTAVSQLRSRQGFGLEQHFSENAASALNKILKRRFLNVDRARDALTALADRMRSGDLQACAAQIKADTILWLARLSL